MTRASTRRALMLLLLLAGPACVSSRAAGQQVTGAGTHGWSPLRPVADLGMQFNLPLSRHAGLLDAAVRHGLFSMAGNPAAAAWEVAERHGEIGAHVASTDGTYRRPLEPDGVARSGMSGFGWQPVGGTSALAGSFAFDQTTHEPGVRAVVSTPYAMSPFVVTDTTRSTHAVQRAHLEGAGGWRLGRVSLGLAAGYAAHDGYARGAAVPRRSSLSMPAGIIGLATELADGVLAGVHVREQRDVEVTQILDAGRGTTYVHRLNGFAEPTGFVVQQASYYHRREAVGRAAGAGVAGVTGAWSWGVAGEVGRREARHWTRRAAEPDTDTWTTSAVDAGAFLSRPVRNFDFTAELRRVQLDGEAVLADADSPVFEADEDATLAVARVALPPGPGTDWAGLFRVVVALENRDRRGTGDFAPRVRTEATRIALDAEGARRLGDAVWLAAGASHERYMVQGTMPAAELYPAAVRGLLSADASWLLTPRSRTGGSVGVLWQVSAGTALRLSARGDRAQPASQQAALPDRPAGDRTDWGLSLTAVLR
jgi:hypothetical protein